MGQFEDIIIDDGRTMDDDKGNNYIVFVIDHSGSMVSCKDLALSNFNEKINEIKIDKTDLNNLVTIIEFDHKIRVVYENELIENIEPLEDFWIGGSTALLDAVGTAIMKVKDKIRTDKNDAALIIVLTDGKENASIDFNKYRVDELTKEIEDTDACTVVFLGGNIDVQSAGWSGASGMKAMSGYNFDNYDAQSYNKMSRTFNDGYKKWSTLRSKGTKVVSNFMEGG